MTNTPRADDAMRLQASPVGLGWALKRAFIGVLILFVVISTAAWLLHSSIDPVLESEGAGATRKAAAPIVKPAGLGL
jgi:hypothetical protein